MKYKGYYIDKVVFNSKEDIDIFLKEQAVKAFRDAVWLFWKSPSMEASIFQDKAAEKLNREFGMAWADIEELEIATLAELNRKQNELKALA